MTSPTHQREHVTRDADIIRDRAAGHRARRVFAAVVI
jgi:hypothetical protein